MGEGAGVMLVEDHSLFRQALAVLIDGEPDLRVVAQAGSLAEAREHAANLGTLIRVAVLDFALPDGDGRELIPELRRASPGVGLLALTANLQPNATKLALEAGADAFLHKTATRGEILTAVRRVLKD